MSSLALTEVTDDGLAHLRGLHNLRDLYLNHTRVGDAGLVHLAALENLRHLHFGRLAVSEEAVRQLQEGRPELRVWPRRISP